MKRLEATGTKATRTGLWLYFMDRSAAVARPRAVLVRWDLLADRMEEIETGTERVFVGRLKAAEEQDYLPLEKWE